MPQFDKYILVSLVITTTLLMVSFYYLFLVRLLVQIKTVQSFRKRLAAKIKKQKSTLDSPKYSRSVIFQRNLCSDIARRESKK